MAGEYDYIIIGAGSAGCVLAGRLSEDGDKRILVLEAGGEDKNWLIGIPLGVGKIWFDPRFNWSYTGEPEPHVDNRRIFHPRGKVVGGSSSINMMAYVRGHRHDFDRWAELGLTDWSYADILPYFKRAETFAEGENTYRGGGGPLDVRKNVVEDGAFDAFVRAGENIGYKANDDYNGAVQEGFSPFQYSIRDGRRCSAAVAWLRPALTRGVKLQTRAHVTRIVMEGGRAVGVEYRIGRERHIARTGGEVICCGGAYNSPQILMLSGIGPADHLRANGIEPKLDLPGVGQNLWDHPVVHLEYTYAAPSRFPREMRLDRIGMSMIRAHLAGTGFAAQPPGTYTAFVRSAPEIEVPDIQIITRYGARTMREWFPGLRKPERDAFGFPVCHLRQESRGSVTLASGDPTAKAKIFNNFLSTEKDVKAMREGVRIVRRIANDKAYDGIRGREVLPETDLKTDADIDAWVRSCMTTIFHPGGTCRIGTDSASVVDPEFRVRGVEGLRVVDASVAPEPLGGNINAPVLMIAEKASDIIRGKPALPRAPIN